MKKLTLIMFLMIGAVALQSCKEKKEEATEEKTEVVEKAKEEVKKEAPKMDMAAKAKEKFAGVDANNDGKATIEEFVAHAKAEYKNKDKNGNGKIEKDECKMFDAFNTDKNDFLSVDEFVKGHEGKFADMDSNKDKSVSFEEFSTFMASMMKGGKCGEGKCGDGKKAAKKEGMKCGPGKCGDGMKKETKG